MTYIMEKNMAVGNPASNIFYFTIPILIGNIFQQVYNIIDTIIVGKFVSTQALAAVGSTGSINFLILGFLMGLMAGITVLTSQRFGAGDMKGMRKSVASAGVIAIVSCILMTTISMLGMKPLMRLMQTPEDIFAEAYLYMMIICFGITAQIMYNFFACILRALGNSKVPLYFLVFSASLNIILDLALIIIFHMGVAGAAIATVFSQGLSAILCLVYIIKKVSVLNCITRDDFRDNGLVMKTQLRVGLPMAFQYSITAIGSTMVQTALNTLGSIYIAGFTAASKAEMIVNQVYIALGSAMATFAAQNVGAGRYDRVRKGFRIAFTYGAVVSIVFGGILFFWGYKVTGLFVNDNVLEVQSLVDIYMKVTTAFLIPLTIVNVFRNGIQGMGYGFLPMMAGVAELIGRSITAVIATHYHSYTGICFAHPAAWMLASTLLLITYVRVMKDKPKG